MKSLLIKNAQVVNRGKIHSADVLIKNGRIEKIAPTIDAAADQEINAEGLHLLPGIIDDQVHFREPGLTHKAELYTEARAAVAGGVTSYMEMPNTKPPAVTQEKLQEKYDRAAAVSIVQHSLNVMLEYYHAGKITLERIVEKMSHAVADCFLIEGRGYIDEGNWADLVLVDLNKEWSVSKDNLLYKCGWSPFEGHTFKGQVQSTIVSGHLAYHNGQFDESKKGERMRFTR